MIEKYINTILCGDALEKLKELPDESIDLSIYIIHQVNLQ